MNKNLGFFAAILVVVAAVLLTPLNASAASEKGPRCSDFLDNDGDGLIDAEDPDCKASTEPVPSLQCSTVLAEASSYSETGSQAHGEGALAVCPEGTVATGGGIRIGSSSTAYIPESWPSSATSWQCSIQGFERASIYSCFAVCCSVVSSN